MENTTSLAEHLESMLGFYLLSTDEQLKKIWKSKARAAEAALDDLKKQKGKK